MKKLIAGIFAAALALSASAYSTDTIQLTSKNLAKPMDITVFVPDKAVQGEKCPSVYLLNGHDGDHTQWSRLRTNLGELADFYGMVMVLTSGQDSWYWDSPIDPGMQMESFFVLDLVPYITKNYNTIDSRDSRAITGLSMGGHGALWLAVRHPDVFGSAGSTSGGVNILPFPTRWHMADRLGKYEDNPQRWRDHTVASQIERFKTAGLNIIFDCGVDDFFAKVNDDLHRDLVKAGVPHDYTSRPGTHSFEYWKNSILYHLLFFNEAFAKAENKK